MPAIVRYPGAANELLRQANQEYVHSKDFWRVRSANSPSRTVGSGRGASASASRAAVGIHHAGVCRRQTRIKAYLPSPCEDGGPSAVRAGKAWPGLGGRLVRAFQHRLLPTLALADARKPLALRRLVVLPKQPRSALSSSIFCSARPRASCKSPRENTPSSSTFAGVVSGACAFGESWSFDDRPLRSTSRRTTPLIRHGEFMVRPSADSCAPTPPVLFPLVAEPRGVFVSSSVSCRRRPKHDSEGAGNDVSPPRVQSLPTVQWTIGRPNQRPRRLSSEYRHCEPASRRVGSVKARPMGNTHALPRRPERSRRRVPA